MKFKLPAKPRPVVAQVKGPDSAVLRELAESPSPFHLKRILVPIDFSECSRQALRYALPLARQFRASVTLLYVVQVYFPSPEAADLHLSALEEKLRRSGEKELDRMLREEVGNQVPADKLVRTGQPYVEIVDAARANDIDLIIISTHGHMGLTHACLGSTAEKVVRFATCPVFVVREKEREFVAP